MFFGSGILKGMLITLKNFFMSYFHGPEDMNGMFTTQYPEQRLPEKERFRNFPFLVYDKNPDNLRCVACDICAKECPPKCIYIVREFDKDNKPLKRPAIFDIDFTVCMNCGICEEACPFDAIYMDHEFEIADRANSRQKSLLYHRDDLLKSNEYFHQIRPTDATAVDAKRAEAEAKKKAAEAAAAAKAAAAAAQPKPPVPPAAPGTAAPEAPKA